MGMDVRQVELQIWGSSVAATSPDGATSLPICFEIVGDAGPMQAWKLGFAVIVDDGLAELDDRR